MVKVKKSVLQACHGAILEAADVELERIIANIADINTAPTKKRSMTITVNFVPSNDRKKITMSTTLKSKIEPTAPIETTLFNSQEVDEKTGEIIPILREVMDVLPGQINLTGDIAEPEIIVIGMQSKKEEKQCNISKN